MESNLKPSDLVEKWKEFHGPTKVTNFYGHSKDNDFCEFSNFYIHDPFEFEIPSFCHQDWMTEKIVEVCFSEKAIMLCKAALMNDEETFEKIKRAKTPK